MWCSAIFTLCDISWFSMIYRQPMVPPWRFSMMTSSNGNIFRVTGHLCGEFTGLRWIPRTKASDAELWCFLWCALIKRLSKHSRGWWFETLSHPLWRHRNAVIVSHNMFVWFVMLCFHCEDFRSYESVWSIYPYSPGLLHYYWTTDSHMDGWLQ